MATVLSREDINPNPGSLWTRADHESEEDRRDIAREHFLKYCDSDKCIRGPLFVIGPSNQGWHTGWCLECAFNPYNMSK